MHNWFRLYVEVVDDPKVQLIPPALFRGWVNIMCLAKIYGDQLPPLPVMAYRLRMKEPQIQRLLDDLRAHELLEEIDGVLKPHGWDDRQFESDSSKERQRRYRERQKQRRRDAQDDDQSDASGDVDGDVGVTSRVTLQEQEEEKDEEKTRPLRHAPPAFRRDETLQPLIEVFVEAGAPVIDEDWVDLERYVWCKYSFEQKLERVKAAKQRLQSGAWYDPAYIPRPRKFCESEWKRPIALPKPKSKPEPEPPKTREFVMPKGAVV